MQQNLSQFVLPADNDHWIRTGKKLNWKEFILQSSCTLFMLGKLNTEEIEELLLQQHFGHIGCSNKGKTYVVPVNYVYDGKYIFLQSVEGLKTKMMRANPLVCFEVELIKNNTNWKTVITQGICQEIVNERERYDAMKIFVDKTIKLKISSTALPPEIFEQRLHPQQNKIKPVLYRIMLLEKTGRFENR